MKTHHIDENSTLSDVMAAAVYFKKETGKDYDHVSVDWLAELFRMMVGSLHAPFEMTFDAPDQPPIIVIYPKGPRAVGLARKQDAVANGQWATEQIVTRQKDGGRKP